VQINRSCPSKLVVCHVKNKPTEEESVEPDQIEGSR